MPSAACVTLDFPNELATARILNNVRIKGSGIEVSSRKGLLSGSQFSYETSRAPVNGVPVTDYTFHAALPPVPFSVQSDTLGRRRSDLERKRAKNVRWDENVEEEGQKSWKSRRKGRVQKQRRDIRERGN